MTGSRRSEFVPEWDGQVCSLGYDVAEWLEEFCGHGPGDVQDLPLSLDSEWLHFLVHAYRIDPVTGRRCYDEGMLSRPKGRAKSELAGLIAVAEAFGPVRFAGWDADGQPVGQPVMSPLVKVLATEESQAGNTFEVAAYVIERGKDEHPTVFGGVSGARQYQSATALYLPHGGEIRACTAGAASKDGGKETFVVADEALALDTPLPTPTGWTAMGDVRVGDRLVGSDGLPVSVVKVTDILDDRLCWRVVFSDGTSIVASDGHLWQTRVAASAALSRVRTTGEMARDGRRFRIPRARALKSADIPLPIDPYILGLWLGDGDARNATITSSLTDVEAVAEQIRARGYTTRRCETHDRAALLYVSLPGSHRNRFSPVKGLKVRLREQGLFQNKHIPAVYLRAGTDQRIELLRGLMDSDGCVLKTGACVFVQTSESLVREVVELLRSLGQDAYVTWRADKRSRQGGSFKVSFTPTGGLVPFSLPRKAARVRQGRQSADWVTVTRIEPVPAVPVRCVGVDAPDSLFVAGDGWKLTHNTHLYVLRELKAMYGTVRRNLGKRKIAQPWMMQTTTAYRPGEQSIAEETLTAWRKGELSPSVYVDHREAKGRVDLEDEQHTLAQLRYVYGEAAGWMDLDRIYREMRDSRSCPDEATAARYYLNRPLATRDAWIATDVVERQACTDVVEPGESIALGFDGSLNDDSTVLIGSRMSDGFLFPVGIWAKPTGPEGAWWEVPRADVLAAIREAFGRYDVSRMYADPHEWRSDIDALAEQFPERVVSWETRRDVQMAAALDRLRVDLVSGALWHSGDRVLMEHFGNAYVRRKGGHRLVRKEYDGSPRKIDSVVGAALAYEARADALAAGWGTKKAHRTAFFA